MHGITSIELTHAVRSPLPGWFVDSPGAGEQTLLEAVRAVLPGLRCPPLARRVSQHGRYDGRPPRPWRHLMADAPIARKP